MDKVLLEKKDGIATITFNEMKKMNGFSEDMVADLLTALEDAEKDDDIRVIILTGQDKIFSAGGDISLFDRSVAGGYKYLTFVLNAFIKVEKTLKPIIAAVNGYALGGGSEITMASDIAIASEDAVFGFPEVGIGIMPGFAILRLHQVVGRTRAKELIMSGRQFDAKEAERIGLINQVVPGDQLMDAVKEKAKVLKGMAPMSLRLAKSVINREIGGEDITTAINTTTIFFGLEDIKEGKNSFFEKRKPNFKGR